jgi:uncharacterized membrane protein
MAPDLTASRPSLPVAAALPAQSGELPHTSAVTPQDQATLLPVTGHGEAAARFVLPKPTDLPKDPIRVYASLQSAPTPKERVDLALRELDRQGAFQRANIFVGVPTGGGHINPVTLELVERMAKGDVASVGIQYGTAPSVLSIGKVDDARDLTVRLLLGIRNRIRQEHPNGGGPRVLLYGESLGGWASQSALDKIADHFEQERRGPVDAFDVAGVDRAAWVGIPGFSRFRADRLGEGGMQAVDAAKQIASIPADSRARARAWDLSHNDDPVHRADLATILHRPKWLPKGGPNPEGVGAEERWRPLLTFVDTVKRSLQSANTEVIGQFGDHGHDYRAELPTLLRQAYGFTDVSDADLARMTEQVRQSEVWIMAQKWQ